MDEDGDSVMFSQFTQSLMLFVCGYVFFSPTLPLTDTKSQTQSGTRYTPHLTRFYASIPPEPLFELIHQAFLSRGPDVVCKVAPPEPVSGKVRKVVPSHLVKS